jgi:hypothetical protein
MCPEGGLSNEAMETPPTVSLQDTPRTYPVATYDGSSEFCGVVDTLIVDEDGIYEPTS